MSALDGNDRCPRAAWLLIAAGLVATGCSADGSEAIGVEVSFDSGLPRSARDQAVRVEVYLLESCTAVTMGDRPNVAIASTFVLRDGDGGAIGNDFDPGQYGLYAVAQDAGCAVIAAGCAAVTINIAAQDSLSVTVGAFSGAGCSVDEQCLIDTGECVGPDGGIGGGVCYAEPDETACTVDALEGVCRVGACCTGCWDGGKCRVGSEGQRCGSSGQLCERCPPTYSCMAGQCAPLSASEVSAR